MSSHRVLLVEDDGFKERHLAELIELVLPSATIICARSVTSCIQALESESLFDLVVLDMSLPTYDVGAGESGGRPQGFGGQTVLHHMNAQGILSHVIVVTQFERFGDGMQSQNLESIEQKLKDLFPEIFVSLIFYSASGEIWRKELTNAINNIVAQGN